MTESSRFVLALAITGLVRLTKRFIDTTGSKAITLPLRRGFRRGNNDFVSCSYQVGDVWSLDDTSYKDSRTRAPRVSGS